jgi:hypothetical protein
MDYHPTKTEGDDDAHQTFRCGRQSTTLLVSSIPLTGFDFRFGLLLYVLSQRATLVIGFFKLAFPISTDITFVRAGIYQLALAIAFFVWHFEPPSYRICKINFVYASCAYCNQTCLVTDHLQVFTD